MLRTAEDATSASADRARRSIDRQTDHNIQSYTNTSEATI